MNYNVLITGATSGIGKAIAYELAGQKCNLVLLGRREQLLQEIKTELQSAFGVSVTTIVADVRDTKKLQQHLESVGDLDVLINNAGLAAGLDLFQDADFNDWETMLDTNVKGLLAVSQIVAKQMVKAKKGHIINISSIAGTQVYEKGNVYCASKHAVDAITKSMRIDLLKHKIKVTSVSPGAVETEFSLVRFKGDEQRADQVYEGFQPLTPEDIARVVAFAINQPAHVNINDIQVMPTAQANAFYTFRG